MDFIELGKTGEKIPELGMGTWKIGAEPEKSLEALETGISLGMKFIDTAEMYGTEEIVGKAIKGNEIFVATKVSPHHFRHDDVIKACEASLERLDVKQIDLYQLHWPNKSVPVTETMRAMEELVKSGKVRHIGVSNFSIEELRDAQLCMKSSRIVSNQIEYSILDRDPENGMLEFCRKEGVTVIAYSPLAQGALYKRKNAKILGLLESIGKRHKKTPTQVALNFLLSSGVAAIPKASSKEHVTENAGAVGWRLTEAERSEVSSFLGGTGKGLQPGS